MMKNSADSLSQSEGSGPLSGRARRAADRSGRRSHAHRPAGRTQARSVENRAGSRPDAAIGIGNGLILGGTLWFLGYLVVGLVAPAF